MHCWFLCLTTPPGLHCFAAGDDTPKKDLGAFCVIHDLAFPKGQAINDLIPNHLPLVSYEDFDHAISLFIVIGEGVLAAKVDIESAFCILPITPHAFTSLVFAFKTIIAWTNEYLWATPIPVPSLSFSNPHCKRTSYPNMNSTLCRISLMTSCLYRSLTLHSVYSC